MRTNRTLLWLVSAAILFLAVLLYRSYTSNSRLNVDPLAADVIEKAKRR
ncbi:MAG TPA: hypothetical protein VGK29_22810 [Paludibaculum sp.]|jgi:hypothetical protein